MILLSGKTVRDELKVKLLEEIKSFPSVPELVIIQVGSNPDSESYIKQKKIFGESLGIPVHHKSFEEDISEEEILEIIKIYNTNDSVTGIIVQLPLPQHLNTRKILDMINPEKDVDGLGTEQTNRFYGGNQKAFIPATARGVISLFDYYQIDLKDKEIAVLGRSDLVGKPVAEVCLRRGAKVTVCHSKTENTKEITRSSDVIIVAIGKKKLVDASYLAEGQVVVDVGIHKTETGLCGDVDFESVKDKVGSITPVPGGVGPLTVLSLFQNLCEAKKIQK